MAYLRGFHGRVLKGNIPWNLNVTKYPVVEGKKQCRDCKKWLMLNKYYTASGGSGGKDNLCKNCAGIKRKKNWKNELKRITAHRRTPEGYYTGLKSGHSLGYKRGKAKYKVILSQSEFVNWYKEQPKKCFYCDMPDTLLSRIDEISKRKYGINRKFYQMTIDRKNNEDSYTLTNIVLACPICNYTKGTIFSAEEFRKLAQKFIKPKWVCIALDPEYETELEKARKR